MVTYVLPSIMNVVEYLDPDGTSPFGRWFATVESRAASKVVIAIARMGQGNLSNAKSVGSGVLEYRIDYGPGYRVYFGRDGDQLVVLLIGGTKQRQQRDISAAKSYWQAYKARKGS